MIRSSFRFSPPPPRRQGWRGAVFASAVTLVSCALGSFWAQPGRANAEAAQLVSFGCDAPAGRTCFFAIQALGAGQRVFSLSAGRRAQISGLRPGLDAYLVSLDAPNNGDLARCRQLTVLGHVCQRKVVDASFND